MQQVKINSDKFMGEFLDRYENLTDLEMVMTRALFKAMLVGIMNVEKNMDLLFLFAKAEDIQTCECDLRVLAAEAMLELAREAKKTCANKDMKIVKLKSPAPSVDAPAPSDGSVGKEVK